jgi:hypothetical protein
MDYRLLKAIRSNMMAFRQCYSSLATMYAFPSGTIAEA